VPVPTGTARTQMQALSLLDPPLLTLPAPEDLPLPALSDRLDRSRRELRRSTSLEPGA